ncbi:glucokinase [Lasius niger]|uniref:Glucokinase n=1 Tax=Lasius niger TaxID=67767 RepID=A0A0J7KFM9_LASNI|nr:glucokinase [Lasius niger]
MKIRYWKWKIAYSGSSGIGAELARQYAGPGIAVTLWGRNRRRLSQIAAEIQAKGATVFTRQIDLEDSAEAIKAFAETDDELPVDVAILAAGLSHLRSAGKLIESAESALAMAQVNFTTPVVMACEAAERMGRRRRGSIAFIGSVASFHDLPQASVYSGTKSEGFPCKIVAVDLGGTHARFAIATIDKERVLHVEEPVTFKCAEYDSLASAWKAFEDVLGYPTPRRAGIAVACPLAAVAHAVAHLDEKNFRHLCGPEEPLPKHAGISIVGPGTGLGVALLIRPKGAHYQVLETEGGHVAFAPQDEIEDKILEVVRKGLCRVSSERIVSGPGLANIYKALGQIKGVEILETIDDRTLWQKALEGTDSLAREALDRFCLALGSVAGDLALAQGSSALVIGGGVGFRISHYLEKSGFAERFQAKGRFNHLMQKFPVKVITHPEPGLFGAAAAYATKSA